MMQIKRIMKLCIPAQTYSYDISLRIIKSMFENSALLNTNQDI